MGGAVAVASSCCQVGVWECVHILCVYMCLLYFISSCIFGETSLFVWSPLCPLAMRHSDMSKSMTFINIDVLKCTPTDWCHSDTFTPTMSLAGVIVTHLLQSRHWLVSR